VPTGVATNTVIVLTLSKALALGLKNNLGVISEGQTVKQAEARRRIAKSALLSMVNSVLNETAEQINTRTLGVEESTFPVTSGPLNFFDARAARLNQSVLDFVRIQNLRSSTELTKASVWDARNSRDLVVLAVGGSYLQIIATNARIAAARAQVETSKAIYEQASDRLKAGLNARIDETRSRVQLQICSKAFHRKSGDRRSAFMLSAWSWLRSSVPRWADISRMLSPGVGHFTSMSRLAF
jgi:outer membrane protein TolC